jgi:ketosteroid isomerase-like protein
MTMSTTETQFDLDAFVRGWGEWDMEALLGCYAEEVEIVQIDRDNPPSAPRVRHGRETIEGMARHCAGAGVKATVEGAVADGDRAAATITCEFPGGRRVVGNSILTLRDGRIVRQLDLAIGDPQG